MVDGKTEAEKQMIRYLLGDLSDEEKARLEERFLGDDTYFEQLSAVEEDLIEAYIQSELEEPDRERFEQRFMQSPAQRVRVDRTVALLRALEAARRQEGDFASASSGPGRWIRTRPGRRPLQVLLAAAALLIVVTIPWLLIQQTRLRAQIVQLQADLRQAQQKENQHQQQEHQFQQQIRGQSERIQQLTDQWQSTLNRRSLTATPRKENPWSPHILALTAGRLRDPDGANLPVIPASSRALEVRLYLEGAVRYPSYRAEMRIKDLVINTQSGLLEQSVASQRVVLMLLGPIRWPSGEGQIILWGVTADGKEKKIAIYPFRVD